MSESSLSNQLQAAIQDVKQGNLKAGKIALAQVINTEPNSSYAEKAWLWMSATFSDTEQKRMCLENALKINPDNVIAQKGLKKLPPPPVEFEDPDWLIADAIEREIISTVAFPKNGQTQLNQEQKASQKKSSDYHSLNLKLVTVLIIMGFLALFLFLGSLNSSDSPTNHNQTNSSSSYSVTYRVIGSENRAIVMSGNSANNQPITVQLPWQHTMSMKYGDTAALIATGETNKTVKCEIYVNGELRTSATSSAAMDNMAVCGYVVGRNVPINVVP